MLTQILIFQQVWILQRDDIKYCYCTEFILESSKVEDTKIRDIMMAYGDSLAVVGDDGVIKVHVHTNDPGNVLQEALSTVNY